MPYCLKWPEKRPLPGEVAVVERFRQESMYGLSTKTVAVVERWP